MVSLDLFLFHEFGLTSLTNVHYSLTNHAIIRIPDTMPAPRFDQDILKKWGKNPRSEEKTKNRGCDNVISHTLSLLEINNLSFM